MKFLMMVMIGVLATFNIANAQDFGLPNDTLKFWKPEAEYTRPVVRKRASQPRKVVRTQKPVRAARVTKPVVPSPTPVNPTSFRQEGMASYYWQGQRTANGEYFNAEDMTAAHRTLPFGSIVKVTARNGKRVTVRINDRGPFNGRIIDLSRAAAREIGMISAGVAPVVVERIR